MQIEHGFCNRETETVALCAARGVSLIICLPQPGQGMIRDGVAGVGYRKHTVRDADRDAASLGRVLHGVFEQRVQCPCKQRAVCIDRVFVVGCKFCVQSAVCRERGGKPFLCEGSKREFFSTQRLHAGLKPRQLKHFAYTAVHALRLRLDDIKIMRLLFRSKVVP